MINPDACREASTLMAQLSPRERDVIVLAGKGLTNVEIGAALDISSSTVNEHQKSAFRKLDVHNRTEAAVIATKAGLV